MAALKKIPVILANIVGGEKLKYGDVYFSTASSKIMLFELFLLCLADGRISETEEMLLRRFSQLQKMDSIDYDEIKERAESMNREVGKTLALILE